MNSELAENIQNNENLDKVMEMAYLLLRSGLSAGSSYDEVWIRDLNTFIDALLDVAPADKVRESLLTFFHFQGEDGNIVDGYVPIDVQTEDYDYVYSKTCPKFKAHKNTVETDQESSLVLAVCTYVRKTGDRSILYEELNEIPLYVRMVSALEYPLLHRFSDKYSLIWGGTTSDWGDVQPEHTWGVKLDENSHKAVSIYANALYIQALSELLKTLRLGNDAREEWESVLRDMKKNSYDKLWDTDSQKFIPHLYLEGSPFPDDFDENQIYYHGGTAVAIAAGILNTEEVYSSYKRMKKNKEDTGAATIGLTIYPAYPDGFFKNPLMKSYSYQNGGDWTWFGGRMIKQLVDHGFIDEAYEELQPMLQRVIDHNDFYEWWTIENEPKGSRNFRGSAGVLVEAIKALRKVCSN